MVVWPEIQSEAASMCLEDSVRETLSLFGSGMAERCDRVRRLLGADEVPGELRVVVVLDITLDSARALPIGRAGAN
jgi:hypothetical protein